MNEHFDRLTITINDKELNAQVGKRGEMKKAMPFVQNLKRRLISSRESPEAVFDRKLPFDEQQVLSQMIGGLKRTAGYKEIELIAVNEGGKSGEVIRIGENGEVIRTGEVREGLSAENAVPGQPTFTFANVD